MLPIKLSGGRDEGKAAEGLGYDEDSGCFIIRVIPSINDFSKITFSKIIEFIAIRSCFE